MWGAGWAAGQTDAVTSSLHTVEGELETAEGGFGNIFVRDLGWKSRWDPMQRIPTFGIPAPTVSFGGNTVMMRGAGSGRLLATCLQKEKSVKEHIGILWLLRRGLAARSWRAGGLKLGWERRSQPVTTLASSRLLQVAPIGFLKGKATGEGRRRLLGLPSGAPGYIFMSCLKWKSNFIVLYYIMPLLKELSIYYFYIKD